MPRAFYLPHMVGGYDPRPTTTTIRDRDAIIEAQRAKLHDIDLWAKRLRGPCTACRWKQGDGGYERCMNPAVIRGTTDPVNGDISWEGPKCNHEREAEEYPEEWGKRWADHAPLCGPEGLLFEPRTYRQFLVRWAIGGLNLLWIWALCGFAAGIIGGSIGPHG